jgi:aspartate racemase
MYEVVVMKKLGLIGGMGPESTLLYYHDIVYKFQKEEPNGYFPALTIETVNMYEMLAFCKNKDYSGLTEYLMGAIENVIVGGADFIALASNTPHVVFDELEKRSSVQMLSIVEPAYKAIDKLELKKIAWLGTAFTMEEEYFKKLFIENGVEVVIPKESERKYIDEKIAKELEFGVIKKDTKTEIDVIINRLIEQEGIQGIIFGCTELPLLYKDDEFSVPCFDTMKLHIAGIVDYMLE